MLITFFPSSIWGPSLSTYKVKLKLQIKINNLRLFKTNEINICNRYVPAYKILLTITSVIKLNAKFN